MNKNKESGENDVDAIVLDGGYVQSVDCDSIIRKKCYLEDWDCEFGYYELDNDTKYSITKDPKSEFIYARGAHFGLYQVDPNDHIDYLTNRVQLARDKPGREIMLTAGGHRKSKGSIKISSMVLHSIAQQFRQSSYVSKNGCVWLSACLLIHSVDTSLAKMMIDRYANNEVMFEWLDIFKRKKRTRQQLTTNIQSNLCDQIRNIKGIGYDLRKVSLFKDYKSANITDLILKEKKEGLFVAMLSDCNGNQSHAVGIDVGTHVVYDCMEYKQLQSNRDNLSIFCGDNVLFHHIELVGELKK